MSRLIHMEKPARPEGILQMTRARWHSKAGQASVEYVIVALVFLAIVVGLGALGGRLQEGLFVEHAMKSASHAMGTHTMGVIGDVLLY